MAHRIATLSLLLLAASAFAAAPDETGGMPLIGKNERLPLPDVRQPPGEAGGHAILVSETSALIYWQTANRARSYVEYGTTKACGERTKLSPISWVVARPYYSQFHRIKGLKPGVEYHYRTVSVGTDKKEVRGEGSTFRTKKYTDAIRIPGDLEGPPYKLNHAGATYVLTTDIAVPRMAFLIQAGLTLDLDGHTVTYNEEAVDYPKNSSWSQRRRGDDAVFGIRVDTSKHPVKVLNGSIRQGKGNSRGTNVGIGANPIYCGGPATGSEFGGLELIWAGHGISGLYLHWGQAHVHHCVFDDRGRGISNRHQAMSSIDGNSPGGHFDHNLVKATRQQGLMGAVKAGHNEIYINSCATNSFGIGGAPAHKVDIGYNKIFGIGEHPVGIAMMRPYLPGTKVHHNHVEVLNTRRGREYGWTGSACFRTTWGSDWLDVGHNTFVGYAKQRDRKRPSAGKTRVLWVGLPALKPARGKTGPTITDARGIFHGNEIRAVGLGRGAKAAGIAVVCLNESPNLIFHANRVYSTWSPVLLGDEYGHSGGHPKFVGNLFERVGSDPAFVTIRHQYGAVPGTGVFLANEYAKGAKADDVKLGAKGHVVFQKHLPIVVTAAGEPVAGAAVVVTGSDGKEVFRGTTAERPGEAMMLAEAEGIALKTGAKAPQRGAISAAKIKKGRAHAIVTASVHTQAGAEQRGPFTVTVTKGRETATKKVAADHEGSVELKLPGG